jgi:hypothetical protein
MTTPFSTNDVITLRLYSSTNDVISLCGATISSVQGYLRMRREFMVTYLSSKDQSSVERKQCVVVKT